MAQDLENRAPETEVAFITGKIASWGKEVGVPTPVSDKLVALVKDAAAKRQGSPKMSPDELQRAVGMDGSRGTCAVQ